MTPVGIAAADQACVVAAELFAGSGAMRAQCRASDWAATPLGAVDQWPQSLRTAAAMVLGSGFAMVVLWGPELIQLYNDGYVPLLAAKHPAGLGMATRACWPEVWPINAPIYARVRAGETVSLADAHYPVRRAGPDGPVEDLWLTLSYSPIPDDMGGIGGVLVTLVDTTAQVYARRLESERERLLTDERAARERAEESERRFRATADAAPVLIWTAAADTACDWFNAGWVAYSGRPLAALVGDGWAEDVHPDDRDRCLATYLDAFHARRPFSMEYRLRRNDGAYRWFLDSGVPRVAADGTFVGYIGTCADVTEPRLAREAAETARAEAEAARAEAERANRTKAEFLATMSHELRTPLTAIGGYAELLELGIRGAVTEAQRLDLGRIRASQQHLLGLIGQVLDLAKADAGEIRVARSTLTAGETVDAAMALIRPQAAAKALAVSAACDGAADLPYVGDEARVRQVLINLLANAIKFTPAGGEVRVGCGVTDAPATVVLRPGVPYVALSVADTGTGIPAPELERIFEPFAQVDSGLTRVHGGTGLGLTISRHLARLMGGDLTVESHVGAGSTFTLWLPTPERRSARRAAQRTPAATHVNMVGAAGW